MHIEICAGGWNAGDGPTGKKDVELFFSGALIVAKLDTDPHRQTQTKEKRSLTQVFQPEALRLCISVCVSGK